MNERLLKANGLTPEDLKPKPRPEERLEAVEQRTDALEMTTDDMILLMAELIGGNES